MREEKTAIIVNDRNQIYCGTQCAGFKDYRVICWADNDQEQLFHSFEQRAQWRMKHGHSHADCCSCKVGYVFSSEKRARRTLAHLHRLLLANTHDGNQAAVVS